MNNLLRNRAIVVGIGIIAAFSISKTFVKPELFKLYLDAGRVGVWSIVWFVTLKLAFQHFLSRAPLNGSDILAIAINMTAGIVLAQAIWIPFKREVGVKFLTQGFMDTTAELLVLGFMVAGALYLLPIGNTIGVTPPRNYWFLFAAGVVGALIAGIFIGIGIPTSLL